MFSMTSLQGEEPCGCDDGHDDQSRQEHPLSCTESHNEEADRPYKTVRMIHAMRRKLNSVVQRLVESTEMELRQKMYK
jgi:hypothetical protein